MQPALVPCTCLLPVRSNTRYLRYHRKLVKALAENRGIDSFRFDFAHAKYNQPGWVWHMAKIERDVEEMREVVLYLEQKLGYKVDLSRLSNNLRSVETTQLVLTILPQSSPTRKEGSQLGDISLVTRIHLDTL